MGDVTHCLIVESGRNVTLTIVGEPFEGGNIPLSGKSLVDLTGLIWVALSFCQMRRFNLQPFGEHIRRRALLDVQPQLSMALAGGASARLLMFSKFSAGTAALAFGLVPSGGRRRGLHAETNAARSGAQATRSAQSISKRRHIVRTRNAVPMDPAPARVPACRRPRTDG